MRACLKARSRTLVHACARREYFMCRVTALVRSHKCHPAAFAPTPHPTPPPLSHSLRCSSGANELSLQMKPSSISSAHSRFLLLLPPFLLFSSTLHGERGGGGGGSTGRSGSRGSAEPASVPIPFRERRGAWGWGGNQFHASAGSESLRLSKGFLDSHRG